MYLKIHGAALAACTALLSSLSHAAIVERLFADENDCAGYFSGDGTSGFDACTIFINDNGQRIELSPVIAKFDIENNGAESETNQTVYPSISANGDEFALTGTGGSSGTWTYTQDVSGGDPYVNYWVAKAGNGFKLFWQVDQTAVDAGGVCDVTDTYTLDCLNEALSVNAGSWDTPEAKELSHITFYDSEDPRVIPVPAAIWLFGSAIAGLGLLRKKR